RLFGSFTFVSVAAAATMAETKYKANFIPSVLYRRAGPDPPIREAAQSFSRSMPLNGLLTRRVGTMTRPERDRLVTASWVLGLDQSQTQRPAHHWQFLAWHRGLLRSLAATNPLRISSNTEITWSGSRGRQSKRADARVRGPDCSGL